MTTDHHKKRLNSVAIRIDDEMLEDLRAMAKEQHRPVANLIVAILKDFFADHKSAQKPEK